MTSGPTSRSSQYFLDRVNNTDPISIFKGGYWRDALLTGLEMEERLGVNPYALGAIGSSDTHVSARLLRGGQTLLGEDEHAPIARFRLQRGGGRLGEFLDAAPGDSRQRRPGRGVGRREHPRRDLRRAEAPRVVRHLGPRASGCASSGGFGLDEAVGRPRTRSPRRTSTACRWAETSKAAAAERPASSSGRSATRRTPGCSGPRSSRVGWRTAKRRSRSYDVVCSDGLEPDPETHRCGDNGAQVNLDDCSISRDKGAVELRTTWADPNFDPGARSFYYVRVLENPTCRWSTWDALSLGIEPNPDLHATHQERAWSSPIWYTP